MEPTTGAADGSGHVARKRETLGGGSTGPVFDADNHFHGAMRRPDTDVTMSARRARAMAWWSLVFAVLWLLGLGSILAVILGAGAVIGLRSAAVGGAPLVAGIAGVVLGIIGAVYTVAQYAW